MHAGSDQEGNRPDVYQQQNASIGPSPVGNGYGNQMAMPPYGYGYVVMPRGSSMMPYRG